MKLTPVIRPAAQTEIDAQADYLALHASDVTASRFFEALASTIDGLSGAPRIGAPWDSPHPQLQGIRHCAVRGFPNLLIFYRATDEILEVLHLYHGKQNIAARLDDEADSPDDAP